MSKLHALKISIAEGFERYNTRDSVRFLSFLQSSATIITFSYKIHCRRFLDILWYRIHEQ